MLCLSTSDAQPMSINTVQQVQTDQCTVTVLYSIKNMLDCITESFIECFCKKVITIANVHNQSRHYAIPAHTKKRTESCVCRQLNFNDLSK